MTVPRGLRFRGGYRAGRRGGWLAVAALLAASPAAQAQVQCTTSRMMYFRTGANCPQGVETCDFAMGFAPSPGPTAPQALLMGTGYDMHVFPFTSLASVGPNYQSRALQFVAERRSSIERIATDPSVDPFTGIGALAYRGEHPGRVFQVNADRTATLLWRDMEDFGTGSPSTAAFSLPSPTGGRLSFVVMEAQVSAGLTPNLRVVRIDGTQASSVYDFGYALNPSDRLVGWHGTGSEFLLFLLKDFSVQTFRLTLNAGGALVVTNLGTLTPFSAATNPHVLGYALDRTEGVLYLGAANRLSGQNTYIEAWNIAGASLSYLGRMSLPTRYFAPKAAGRGVVLVGSSNTTDTRLLLFSDPGNPSEIPTPADFPRPTADLTDLITSTAEYVETATERGFVTANQLWAAAVIVNPSCLAAPGEARMTITRSAGFGTPSCAPPGDLLLAARGFPGDTFTLTNNSGSEAVDYLKVRGFGGTDYPEQVLTAPTGWTSLTWGAGVHIAGVFEFEYKLTAGDPRTWYVQTCPDPRSPVAITAVNGAPCTTCAWLQGDTLTLTASREGNPLSPGYTFVTQSPGGAPTPTGPQTGVTTTLPLSFTGDYRAGLVTHYAFPAADDPACNTDFFAGTLSANGYNSCVMVTPDPIPSGPGTAAFEVWQSGVKKADAATPGTLLAGQPATLRFTGKIATGWAPRFDFSNLPPGVTVTCPYPGSAPYTGFECTTNNIPESAARTWALQLTLCQGGTPGQGCADPFTPLPTAPGVSVAASSNSFGIAVSKANPAIGEEITVTVNNFVPQGGFTSISVNMGAAGCDGSSTISFCGFPVSCPAQGPISRTFRYAAGPASHQLQGSGNLGQVTVTGPTVNVGSTGSCPAAQQTLTVTKSGTGSGTVTSSPSGISCGAVCNAAFDHGTSVTLTAQALLGSQFAGWTGACAGTGTCVVSMTQARAVNATFNTSGGSDVTLTVIRNGTGSGTVSSSPAGMTCTFLNCQGSYPVGTTVTLTPNPAAGSTFAGWSGGGCSGSGNCVLTLSGATSTTATFNSSTPPVTVAVSKTGTGSGTVTSSPSGINCGSTCSAQFTSGASLTLSASPGQDSTFAGWSGPCSGTGPCIFTPTANTTVTAQFAPMAPAGSFNIASATQIGQQVTFTIPTVPTGVTAVRWTMGGASCPNDPFSGTTEVSCYPSCSTLKYRYATAGTKQVRLEFYSQVTGTWTEVDDQTLEVANTGSCGASWWPQRPAAALVPDLAARISGATLWESEMALYNPGAEPLIVDLYARTPQNNVARGALTIPGGGVKNLDDALDVLLADNPAVDGKSFALWMQPPEDLPDGPLPVISARTFTTGGDGGTYGQALPVVPVFAPAEYASTLWVTGAMHHGTASGFRTNVTVINPADKGWGASKGITLTLYRAGYPPLTRELKGAAPFQVYRYNPIPLLFGLDKDTVLGEFTLKVDVPAGVAAMVGCSVNDNLTNDSYLLLAQPEM